MSLVKPPYLIEAHKSLCPLCASKASDPCASCDHNKWYKTASDRECGKSSNITGAGDLLAAMLSYPVAAIDSIFQTDFKNCIPCKEKQASLNDLIPF